MANGVDAEPFRPFRAIQIASEKSPTHGYCPLPGPITIAAETAPSQVVLAEFYTSPSKLGPEAGDHL